MLRARPENLVDRVRGVSGATVCERGCGQGQLAHRLLAQGASEITCVDIFLAYLNRLSRTGGLIPVLANAESLPFRDVFDIVVSTDVMEHVLNVGSFLYCLNRSLKVGGRAYIRVPYKESLLGYSPQLGCKFDFAHLRSFDESILRDYLKDAEFVIENFVLDGFVFSTPQPFWTQSRSRMLRYEGLNKLASAICQNPADVTRWPSMLARKFMKPQEIIAIARKTKTLAEQRKDSLSK